MQFFLLVLRRNCK